MKELFNISFYATVLLSDRKNLMIIINFIWIENLKFTYEELIEFYYCIYIFFV